MAAHPIASLSRARHGTALMKGTLHTPCRNLPRRLVEHSSGQLLLPLHAPAKLTEQRRWLPEVAVAIMQVVHPLSRPSALCPRSLQGESRRPGYEARQESHTHTHTCTKRSDVQHTLHAHLHGSLQLLGRRHTRQNTQNKCDRRRAKLHEFELTLHAQRIMSPSTEAGFGNEATKNNDSCS